MVQFGQNIRTKSVNGLITISCRKGLWEVTGGDREVVEGEAMHYYLQYLGDGEYDDVVYDPLIYMSEVK